MPALIEYNSIASEWGRRGLKTAHRGKEHTYRASERPARPSAEAAPPLEKSLKTHYFSAQGPRREEERELYQEALRMMHNIENFATKAGLELASQADNEGDMATAVIADQPCQWEGSQAQIELKANAVVKVDTSAGQVVACHAVQASSEVENFAFRLGDDGARLYDWTATGGNRQIHVYTGNQEELEGFLVIVQE